MKILVYGAGVIGSYLAYELNKSGFDVTILARGKRYEELKSNGLVIHHKMQMRTTSSKLKVVDKFLEDDEYDLVFVVMQRSQIDSVIPIIAKNTKCKLYAFIGNNGDAKETLELIKQKSVSIPQILFGFLVAGGRRENGKVISFHVKAKLVLGSLDDHNEWKKTTDEIKEKVSLKVVYENKIDDWLKSHIAFVLPLAFVVYYANGDLKKVRKNKVIINQAIDAIGEGFNVLTKLGYDYGDVKALEKKRKKLYWFFRICCSTSIGKLIASDHAMGAKDEMIFLRNQFHKLIVEAKIATPSWDNLEQYMFK